MTYKGEAWVSDFKLPVGNVVARGLVAEEEPHRFRVHVLATEWMPPMEVASSVDGAKRRAVELIAERWPLARPSEWRPKVEAL